MKKFTLLVSFLLLFTISGFAQKQKTYSVTNLEQASQEDLNIYLDKALKHKKNGKTVTIVGASALGVSIIYIIIDPAMALMSGLNVYYLGVPAIVTTTVGAIMLTKGSARVKRINKIKKTNRIKKIIKKICTDPNHYWVDTSKKLVELEKPSDVLIPLLKKDEVLKEYFK